MFLEILPKLSVSEFMRIGLKKLALVKYSGSMRNNATQEVLVKDFGVENILHHIW